jgi:hypothetical protein
MNMHMTREKAVEILEQAVEHNPLFARVLTKTILARKIRQHEIQRDKAAAAGDDEQRRLHNNLVESFKQQYSEIKLPKEDLEQ